MSEMKTSEVLDLAADKIEEAGWVKGHGWVNNGDGLCLEGGIVAAMGMTEDLGKVGTTTEYVAFQACPAYRAVQSYLETRVDLWIWNDQIVRTRQDVIETLRATAAVERAKEESLEGSVNKEGVAA